MWGGEQTILQSWRPLAVTEFVLRTRTTLDSKLPMRVTTHHINLSMALRRGEVCKMKGRMRMDWMHRTAEKS